MPYKQLKKHGFVKLVLITVLSGLGVSSLSGCIIVEHEHHWHHWHRW